MKSNFILTLTLVTFLGIASNANAQDQVGVLENGKKIIVKSDGTWIYSESTNEIKNDTSDCDNWIITETDKMEGTTSTHAKKNLIVSDDGGKTGFGILLMRHTNNIIVLSIQAVGASSCIDEGAKINILFADGSRLLLNNQSNFNCKGKSTVYFGGLFGNKSELKELRVKKIQTMRVWTSDSFVEKDFTVEDQNEFFNVINCLTK